MWLFLAEPGLGGLLEKELKHRDVLRPKTRVTRLLLRNYDLLVVPQVQVRTSDIASRIALDVLLAPVFGRHRIAEGMIDRLAAQWRVKGADGIVASVAGSAFQRQDVLHWLARRLAARGITVSSEPRNPVRLLIVDESFYFGFARFNHHDVPGRIAAERAGSLPATIAAAMCFAGHITKDKVIWDPVMGTGTVLREAAALAPDATLVGSDLDVAAVEIARRDLGGRNVKLVHGDSTALGLDGARVTLTIGNLPFGKQYGSADSNRALYEGILGNSLRNAGEGWRAVLLTSDEAALRGAVDAIAGLALERIAALKTRGHDAVIWLVKAR